MPSTFISLVGFQPSAVAIGLASWLNAYPDSVSSVVLLATEDVKREGVVNRLKKWIASTYCIQEVEEIPISSGLVVEGNRLPPTEAIRRWMKQNPESAELIVFNAKPGLNPHVVTLGQELSGKAFFLSPMVGKISVWAIQYGEEQWDDIPPANLGLKALLDLYGIRFQVSGRYSGLITQLIDEAPPKQVAQGLELIDADAKFDLAFEKGGFLYVLKVIDTGDTLQQIRDLRRIQKQKELNKLQPQIAVLTPHKKVFDRAKEVKFLRINSESNSGRSRLVNWIKGNVPEPGHQKKRSKKTKRKEQPTGISVSKQVSGAGGSGTPLAVCLGVDPSATLVSLCTHKPKQAWIFYDYETPTVINVAQRLAQQIGEFPVGQVEFLNTDMLGGGIVSTLGNKLGTVSERVRVDISPGTKEQGQALARITGVEVWSLRGYTGEATCISEPNVEDLFLKSPDILTQARCVGGDLKDEGDEKPGQGSFFRLLAKFLKRYLTEKKDKGQKYKGFSLQDVDKQGVYCRDGSLRRLDDEHFKVELDGKAEVGILDKKTQQGGNWFEPLVANAFKSAGADEVRYGVEWGWPQESQYAGHMTEVDVLAKFKHRFVAVSCKKKAKIAQARREIEAVAESMGRFCIPILAEPLSPDEEIQKSFDAQEEATVLDLRHLTKPEELVSTLEVIFRNRSTVN